jgi:transcriptional regulator with XRE-family HTH domain
MQALSDSIVYDLCMATASHLRALREKAGVSQRELARQIGEDHSNVRYWESSGNLPRSNVLFAIAQALGVSVEELLGEPKPVTLPPGKLGDLFKAVTQLHRDEQQRIMDFVEAYVEKRQGNGQQKAA